MLAGAVALLASALLPTAASAQTQDIASAGPLTHIYLGNALECQVDYAGEGQQFFLGIPANCRTFLRTGSDPGEQATLIPVGQSPVMGSGTTGDPYRVVTQVTALDSSQMSIGLGLERTDTYVVGQDFYRSDVIVTSSNPEPVTAVLWHGADCLLQGSDGGYGFFDAATGGIFCTKNPNNSPADRTEGFVPLSPNSRYFEGDFFEATSDPGAGGFPNTCACDTLLDNGMGLSWNFLAPAEDSISHSFITKMQPGPPPIVDPPPVVDPPPLTLADLPNPVLGKNVNVQTLSGVVRIGVRTAAAGSGRARASQKGVKFVPLSEARQIPVGSLLDTRKGKVRLQSARNQRGTRQNGDFARGLFQVLQSRKRKAKGLTEVRLKGSSFASCKTPRRKRRARGAATQVQASASRRIRRLSANTRGRFRTRGRHSSATVRGTKWTMTDRCDGTLTQVTRGAVTVRDFRRKKTIVVKAGKSYLAKARR